MMEFAKFGMVISTTSKRHWKATPMLTIIIQSTPTILTQATVTKMSAPTPPTSTKIFALITAFAWIDAKVMNACVRMGITKIAMENVWRKITTTSHTIIRTKLLTSPFISLTTNPTINLTTSLTTSQATNQHISQHINLLINQCIPQKLHTTNLIPLIPRTLVNRTMRRSTPTTTTTNVPGGTSTTETAAKNTPKNVVSNISEFVESTFSTKSTMMSVVGRMPNSSFRCSLRNWCLSVTSLKINMELNATDIVPTTLTHCTDELSQTKVFSKTILRTALKKIFHVFTKFILGERDVATCDALAGAPPCYYLDFSGIYTARQFHIRMEELYHYWLKKHCNPEWRVHFEALLKRMRNSLFCDDGSAPDHHGYNISPAPPVYKPSEAPYVYKVFYLITFKFSLTVTKG